MKVCFVCTGNTCRSPMAEHMLRYLLTDCPQIEICSAGINALSGDSVSDGSLQVMLEKYGLDLSVHRATRLDREIVVDSNYIYTMTKHHKQILIRAYPELQHKIETIGEATGLAEVDVSDPYGYSIEEYRQTADQLHFMLDRLADKLRKHCQKEK